MARGYMEDIKRSKTYDEFKFRRPDITGLTKEVFLKLKKSGYPPVPLRKRGQDIIRETASRKGGGKIMIGYKAGGKV